MPVVVFCPYAALGASVQPVRFRLLPQSDLINGTMHISAAAALLAVWHAGSDRPDTLD